VATKHPKVDVVIVRENEEDLYAGIEHRQTHEVYQCLKLISRPGCERIVRYAFEYARTHGRKRVCAVAKDNIMKLTDGLFMQVFEDIGKLEYPDIKRERMIVDIAAAMLADQPERFDVMVMPNLYGDISSDLGAGLIGGLGLTPSGNIGETASVFEAVHGTAPDIAGQNKANPTALLLSACMMLRHIGENVAARRIEVAVDRVLGAGEVRTGDLGGKSSTTQYTEALIAALPAAGEVSA
jgi:isocitrate dehydrogenase